MDNVIDDLQTRYSQNTLEVFQLSFFPPSKFLKIPDDQKDEIEKIKTVANDFQILLNKNEVSSQLLDDTIFGKKNRYVNIPRIHQ